MLFASPLPDLEDSRVTIEIHQMRSDLTDVLRTPRRWTGLLRRTSAARNIQGSNTIEGYTVTDADAAAAVDDEPPLSADKKTWAEIKGYQRVMTYALNVGTTPSFVTDETAIRAMHFILLEHDLASSPGRYRDGTIYVRDEGKATNVYTGPEAERVPTLMRAFADWLAEPSPEDPMVRAAMAHLNLVLIHPFKDGNGRMARALQTLALARDGVGEPVFSSIEEWLGHNTQDYYDVLAATAQGSWNPSNDTAPWLKFNLRAHHMQAQTVRRRFAEAEKQWSAIDELLRDHHLDERLGSALFDANLGLRVTRPSYIKLTGLDSRTATRDLVAAAEAGLLEARGERRGRYYVAGRPLAELQAHLRSLRTPLVDPYPTLRREIRSSTPD